MAMDVAKKGGDEDYSIKPEAVTPAVDTSTWPLLLKNCDKREFLRSKGERSERSGRGEGEDLTYGSLGQSPQRT